MAQSIFFTDTKPSYIFYSFYLKMRHKKNKATIQGKLTSEVTEWARSTICEQKTVEEVAGRCSTPTYPCHEL